MILIFYSHCSFMLAIKKIKKSDSRWPFALISIPSPNEQSLRKTKFKLVFQVNKFLYRII